MTPQTHEFYIRTTVEQLWEALTTGAKTEQFFFGSYVESQFKPGSELTYTQGKGGPVMVDGQIVELEPARRFVHTWVVRYDPSLANETSRVSWLFEPRGENVKVTVSHDCTKAPLTAAHLATDGWSIVLSSLKSLLETGRGLVLPPMS